MTIEEQLAKIQDELLSIKTDLVYVMYLIERIDKNTAVVHTPPPEPPFPTEGMIVEKF